MSVDRCYCREITFRQLKALAERVGKDVNRLCEASGAGTSCGLCRPYIRVMLATGRTELPVLTDADVERLCTSPGDVPHPTD